MEVPQADINLLRMSKFRALNSWVEEIPKRIVLSTNWEWLAFFTPLVIFRPLSSPLFCRACNFFLIDSATMRYKRGDKGKPWRSSREAWKKPAGLSLTSEAIHGLPTQALIHLEKKNWKSHFVHDLKKKGDWPYRKHLPCLAWWPFLVAYAPFLNGWPLGLWLCCPRSAFQQWNLPVFLK